MTEPSLVAARPWDHEDARIGLLDRAVGARGDLGGHPVAVLPEPLLARVDGVPVQSVRVVLEDGVTADLALGAVRVEVAGERVDHRTTRVGPDAVRVLVTRTDAPVAARLTCPALGEGAVDLELVPQREWTVHVVHHSHFDFGYTDPQVDVFAAQRSYIDSALDLVDRTADWPEAARFRWNAEALWAVTDWLDHRPPGQVQRLLDAVAGGSIGLSAMPYNLHTDVCSTDELHELLRDARRLKEDLGISFTSAMQTDVPGQVAGLPDALSGLGVRSLAVAHNWAGRSEPLRNGGLDLPRLFRWRSLSGAEVLVWMTDSPHGLAYLEGSMIGFGDAYDTVDRYLPAYLTNLSSRGFPYPVGIFGGHGETFERAEPYPWDVVHIRALGFMGDNGPARTLLSEIVREWNDTWESPRLRVSRNEDFFADAEARYGTELETFEGDWGDWWVEGVGSAAVPMAQTRVAQAAVTDARSLSQLSRWLGGEAVATEAADAASVYDAVSMFNEHTWGAGNSWTHGDSGFDSGERQWQWKVAQAHIGHQRATESVEKALAYLGEAVPAEEAAGLGYVVANPGGRARSGIVRFLLPEAAVPLDHDVALLDVRHGTQVPLVLSRQDHENHRESGRWVTAHVRDVPAFGVIRLHVDDLGPATPEGSGGADASTPPVPDLPRSALLTLENEFLRVVVDDQRSVISSIVERATGRELVRQDAVVGFNGYVYDEYASSGTGLNHLANKLATSDRLELLATRSLASPARVVERTDDAVESRLVYEFRAPGADWVQVTLRLRHGDPWLVVENRLSKPRTRAKESAYLAFPFAGDDAELRFEVSGGVTGDGLPHVPGAPRHMRAVRDWVTVSTGGGSVAWVTPDVPLVQPHAIALPYSPFPDSTAPREPGTVYSWLHNNLWDTNFPIEQGFEATFRYAVGVAADPSQSAEEVALATADELVHPLRVTRARGLGPTDADDGSGIGRPLLELSDPRVRLVSAVGVPGGTLLRLQSFADEPVELGIRLGRPVVRAFRASYYGDVGEQLTTGSDVVLTVERFESVAVLLEPHGVGEDTVME